MRVWRGVVVVVWRRITVFALIVEAIAAKR